MNRFRSFLTVCAAAVALTLVASAPAEAGHHHKGCCQPACCPAPAPACCPAPQPCCPPPPVKVTWCVTNPITCCPAEISACLPACCADSAPTLAGCRRGFFGRKIQTYKFDCGECVDVVFTKHGRVIVRD